MHFVCIIYPILFILLILIVLNYFELSSVEKGFFALRFPSGALSHAKRGPLGGQEGSFRMLRGALSHAKRGPLGRRFV